MPRFSINHKIIIQLLSSFVKSTKRIALQWILSCTITRNWTNSNFQIKSVPEIVLLLRKYWLKNRSNEIKNKLHDPIAHIKKYTMRLNLKATYTMESIHGGFQIKSAVNDKKRTSHLENHSENESSPCKPF